MALIPGARLGPYAIVSPLGTGGMGEVYRARDDRLDRDVAIKVLPAELAADPDRLARFHREAKTLAALNHPNIGSIHGIEEAPSPSGSGEPAILALVMEFVDGEDLAQRLRRGPLAIGDALPIARQIALGLEAAHEQGIAHRDLKPANIKVRPDGTVKLLDFGLAKAVEPAGGTPDLSDSPTVTAAAMTRAGLILGTAAYMSPEQARGKPVDRRTDIWAFGCVLYEMLTARRAFPGDDVSEVLASVLARTADLSALPIDTPPSIRRLLRRCLEKDRAARLAAIGDARLEIADALTSSGDAPVPPAPPLERTLRTERLAWASALLAVVFAMIATWVSARREDPPVSEWRLDIVTPPSVAPESLAISPDGKTLAFVAAAEGASRLWLRSLTSGASRIVAGTDGAELPFWSPDSQSIGFFAEDKLKRIAVDGGAVQTVANARGGWGGTWNADNVIVFATIGRPIARVAATGGDSVAVPQLAQQGSDFAPQFLPDGRRFLYYVRGAPEVRGVYIGQLDAPLEARRILDSDSSAVYAPSGQLLFVREGSLVAQRFDPARLELSGKPAVVAEHVAEGAISVSRTGIIAYRGRTAGIRRRFVWFDRAGRELGAVGEAVTTTLNNPSLSPDGHNVAFYRSSDGNPDIWVVDTRRGGFTRLTTNPADDVLPVWSPDGSHVVFSSNREGVHNVFLKALSGDSAEERVLATGQPTFVTDWSSDGRFLLLYRSDPQSRGDIWAMPWSGDRKAFAVLQTPFDEQGAQFSADGRWMAYQSNESDRSEVYVRPFPRPGNRSLVSLNGGTQVRWSRDGKEIFYVARDGRLMAVPIRIVSNDQTPEIGTPVALFTPPLGGAVQLNDYRHQYTPSADGQRFLVATMSDPEDTPIKMILNWKPPS